MIADLQDAGKSPDEKQRFTIRRIILIIEDLPSTQIIQTHNSHRHNTTSPLQTLVQAVGRQQQQQEVQQL